MYIIQLDKVRKDSILLAGGKGANLGEMLAQGFPVPQGFCITSQAYDAYIEDNSIDVEIQSLLAAADASPVLESGLSEKLMERIKTGRISTEMHAQIESAYNQMGDRLRVAVRSSATAEDLPEASFAGQQETFLNIRGIDKLIEAVKCCFASLWTERAIAYRRKTGFDTGKIALSVVVQEMIESDVSGVLFTVNPLNGSTKEMMINGSYGLGEAVVSGRVTPDTFLWDKEKGHIIKRTLGSKEFSIVYENEGGTRQKPNNHIQRRRFCLSDKQVHALTGMAQKIEAHYGAPQDIEWAFRGNTLSILQSRGITTLKNLGEGNSSEYIKKQNKRERMMMNNLIEHCPAPPFPLDLAPFQAVMEGKRITIDELGIRMPQGDALLLKDTGEMEVHAPTVKVTPRVLLVPFRIGQYGNLHKNVSATRKVWQAVSLQLEDLEACAFEGLASEKLVEKLQELMTIADKIIYVRFRYNIYPSFLLGLLIRFRLKRLTPAVSQYDLLSGLHYKTWDMNVALEELGKLVNRDPALRKELEGISDKEEPQARLSHLSSRYREFGSCYRQILKEYGWKSTNSYLAFSASSWNEDKRPFLSLLRVAADSSNSRADRNKYDAILQRINSTFSPRVSKGLIKRIEEFRIYHQNREESLYFLERCYGLSRRIVKELAGRSTDLFPDVEDVLYLTLNEVYKLGNETDKAVYKSKIQTRKSARVKNQAMWNRMEAQSAPVKKNVLKGISGNTGRAEGKVCLVHDITEFGKLKKGDILVCKYTDPVWTPLFLIAGAVVSDTGGPLSHSAIVAREYNIPAVLGCGNATKVLTDGQKILVDGDSGQVRLLSPEES